MTHSSDPIEYFKKESKKLLQLVKAQRPEALTRVSHVLSDTAELTLMRAQHVIAIEHGFAKWDDLIKAPAARLNHAITRRKIQQKNAKGTPLGIFLRGTGIIPPTPERAAQADMADRMTRDEQRWYLDEDAQKRWGNFGGNS